MWFYRLQLLPTEGKLNEAFLTNFEKKILLDQTAACNTRYFVRMFQSRNVIQV